jgi:hypothetical protein
LTENDLTDGCEHMQRDKQQKKTIAINRGIFLVRYVKAEDEQKPPRVLLAADPASTRDIYFLFHPDHKEAVLWQPGTCLVVRAKSAGKLFVQVIPAHKGGSAAATVRIEPLSQGKPAPLLMPPTRQGTTPYNLDDFRILGHVTGIGDVTVNANEWIAGPSAPSRIEGISMEWPGKPPNLDIHYAVKTARPQTTTAGRVSLGSFAGTRGRAMPIVGLTLELSGPGAANFQFSSEAIFLGSPVARMTGKRVVVSGPTGREPLVGLRLSVETVAVVARPPKGAPTSKPRQSQSRVRVFRSRLDGLTRAIEDGR